MGLDSFEDICAGHVTHESHVTNDMSNSLCQHSIFSLALVTVTVSEKNCKKGNINSINVSSIRVVQGFPNNQIPVARQCKKSWKVVTQIHIRVL